MKDSNKGKGNKILHYITTNEYQSNQILKKVLNSFVKDFNILCNS